MVFTDPYTPDRSRYECPDCGYRETGDAPGCCPECDRHLRNIAVCRE